MGTKERRDLRRRGRVVQDIVSALTGNPSVTLTADMLRGWLNLPQEAAQRILNHLASSGLVREIEHGVWVRKPLF